MFYIKQRRYFAAPMPRPVVNTHTLFEENHMPRHLDNLRRLCRKLQLRYGEEDALVRQVQHELETRERLETSPGNWSTPYREFIKGGTAGPTQGGPSTGAMNSP